MVLATKEATCSRKIHKSNLSENLCDLKFIYSEKAIKILRNLQSRFVLCSASQIYGGDFAKFCVLLRIYELYLLTVLLSIPLNKLP